MSGPAARRSGRCRRAGVKEDMARVQEVSVRDRMLKDCSEIRLSCLEST